jgi:tryptophanyl-tRNA synthetase
VQEVLLDYLACGLDPARGNTHIFPHSYVPTLNQLLVAFLPLVSLPELDRNPTVKEEIRASGGKTLNASTYVYPLHQAADILFCQANLVPVGKDQLPHLELARKVARRFNERFKPTFREPDALLSETPVVLGLDGQKMSKSRNNAVLIGFDEDQTARAIRSAKTDSNRRVTYDPEGRPELSNLLRLLSLTTGSDVLRLAEEIGDGGAGTVKARLVDALNAYLAPMRARRRELANDRAELRAILRRGIEIASERGEATLCAVRDAMNMSYELG